MCSYNGKIKKALAHALVQPTSTLFFPFMYVSPDTLHFPSCSCIAVLLCYLYLRLHRGLLKKQKKEAQHAGKTVLPQTVNADFKTRPYIFHRTINMPYYGHSCTSEMAQQFHLQTSQDNNNHHMAQTYKMHDDDRNTITSHKVQTAFNIILYIQSCI